MLDRALTPGYWQREEERIAERLQPMLLAIASYGAGDAMGMVEMAVRGPLPKGYMPEGLNELYVNGVPHGPYSKKVLEGWLKANLWDWAWSHAKDLAHQLIDTTRRVIESVLGKWLGTPKDERGDFNTEVVQEIEAILGPARVEAVAITELTNAYTAGELAAWYGDNRVTGKVWRTAEDERVCEFCGPMDGQTLDLHGGFTTEPDGFGPLAPPLHPRCRCWLEPIVMSVPIGA